MGGGTIAPSHPEAPWRLTDAMALQVQYPVPNNSQMRSPFDAFWL